MAELTPAELHSLFRTVFAPRPTDRMLTFLVDVPDEKAPDTDDWRARRLLAYDWWTKSITFKRDLGLEHVQMFYFPNVGAPNADLPAMLYHWGGKPATLDAATLVGDGLPVSRVDAFADTDIVIALTEFSATAPCKILAKHSAFRGATMPGFVPSMLPSLQIDYAVVDDRLQQLQRRLDAAVGERIEFEARGHIHRFNVDLRHRSATASSGLFHEVGVIGNLPSGETYIVPYEGEREADPSGTHGELPVQFGDEIVVYRIERNRAVDASGDGPAAQHERALLAAEPAYGNIAEIGHGILGEFGCTACGNLLMDEKLGLHVAFGRSEHFGGSVSPEDFRDPMNVVHIDRVFVPSLQPDILVRNVVLAYRDDIGEETIMIDGEWLF